MSKTHGPPPVEALLVLPEALVELALVVAELDVALVVVDEEVVPALVVDVELAIVVEDPEAVAPPLPVDTLVPHATATRPHTTAPTATAILRFM